MSGIRLLSMPEHIYSHVTYYGIHATTINNNNNNNNDDNVFRTMKLCNPDLLDLAWSLAVAFSF